MLRLSGWDVFVWLMFQLYRCWIICMLYITSDRVITKPHSVSLSRLSWKHGHVHQLHPAGVAPIIAVTSHELYGVCDHRQLHGLFISFFRLSMDSPQWFPSVMFHARTRADSRLVPSQWETSLQSNAVSHWPGANLESALRASSYVLAELGILAGTDPLCQITEEPMVWLCVD